MNHADIICIASYGNSLTAWFGQQPDYEPGCLLREAAAAPQQEGTSSGSVMVQEYFLMALSQPRSQANRASKHMRVASVTPAHRAASVTAGMEPRNLDVLRKAHEKEQAEKGEKLKKAPPPKGVLRTLKPIASSVASVGPRMVKFRSNIQYLGEKVSMLCAVLSWVGNADQCTACILQQVSLRLVHSCI